MVFASLTSTADVGLFAGFSQVASFPLFQFILPLAPLLCSVSRSSRWQGDNWSSQAGGCFFQGAGQTSFPQLSPPSSRETSAGALRTNRKLSFIEKLLIKKDGKGTNNSRNQKDVCCHLASRLSLKCNFKVIPHPSALFGHQQGQSAYAPALTMPPSFRCLSPNLKTPSFLQPKISSSTLK